MQGLYGTVFVVGLLGNSLVIYVVLRYSKMQTVTNLYILNLAVADQCFLIGIPFIMTTMGLGCWPFGNVMCKVSHYSQPGRSDQMLNSHDKHKLN